MTGDETQKTPIHVDPLHTPLTLHANETAGNPVEGVPTRTAKAEATALMIGPYRVVRTIGQGGMGVVYLVRDDEKNRDVALKVIPSGPDADPNDVARFKIEAEAVSKLKHPNIVQLYEVGETEHEAYIAMEYVEGGTLHRRISRNGPLDPIEAASLVERLARACHYAHENGVLHRDLKPSNILLHDTGRTSENEDEVPFQTTHSSLVPKLADFGLAKRLDRMTRLTLSGTAVGTPHYMAPEQARGEKEIGPALDIHGLGAILYETLTGQPPFNGENAAATMEQVVHRIPTPPNQLRPAVPPALSAICLRCLEKSPNRRYPTAEDLANDLRRFQIDPTDITNYVVLPQEKSSHVPIYVLAISMLAMIGMAVAGTAYFVRRDFQHELDSERQHMAEVSEAEQRSRLAAAIAICERGDIREGIDRMRELPENSELPVASIVAAWQERVLEHREIVPISGTDVVALSSDGRRFAIARNSRIGIWKTDDWNTEEHVWTISGTASALGWSDDDNKLAIGTSEGNVLVADVDEKRIEAKSVSVRPGRPVLAIGFTFPGVRVVLGGNTLEQEYVPPWRNEKKNNIDRFKLHDESIVAATISHASADAAVVGDSGIVSVFDAGNALWHQLPPAGDVTAISFSPHGNVLAIGCRNGAVRLWDAVALAPLTDTFHIGTKVLSLAVSAHEKHYSVLACGEDGKVMALRCGRPFVAQPIRLKNRPGKEVLGVSFTGNGSNLYVTSPKGVSLWRIWDAKRFSQQRDFSSSEQFQNPSNPEAKFSAPAARGPKGTFLIGGKGGKLFLVDEEGATQQKVEGPDANHDVTSLAVSPKGQIASASTANGKTLLRHWGNGMEVPANELQLHCRVNQEAFLPDGSAILLGCSDGHLVLWEPSTNRTRLELDCGSPVLSVAVTPDGEQILAGCVDGTAQLWSLNEKKRVLTVRHSAEVRGVAFLKGNIVTASADGTARRWDAGTGLPIGPAMRHPDAISALDTWGDLIATGGRGRYVRVWRLP